MLAAATQSYFSHLKSIRDLAAQQKIPFQVSVILPWFPKTMFSDIVETFEFTADETPQKR